MNVTKATSVTRFAIVASIISVTSGHAQTDTPGERPGAAGLVDCSSLAVPLERATCLDPELRTRVQEFEDAERLASSSSLADGHKVWTFRDGWFSYDTQGCGLTSIAAAEDAKVRDCSKQKLSKDTAALLQFHLRNLHPLKPFRALVKFDDEAHNVCAAALSSGPESGVWNPVEWKLVATTGNDGGGYLNIHEARVRLGDSERLSTVFAFEKMVRINIQKWRIVPRDEDVDAFREKWKALVEATVSSKNTNPPDGDSGRMTEELEALVRRSRHPTHDLDRSTGWSDPAMISGTDNTSAPILYAAANTVYYDGWTPNIESTILFDGRAYVRTDTYKDRAIFRFGRDGELELLCWEWTEDRGR